MWMQFRLQFYYMWLDILKDFIFSCNDTKHRTIRMKPKNFIKRNEKKMLFNVYKTYNVKQIAKKPKFKMGDKVRIRKF